MPAVQTTYPATMRPGTEGQYASEWGGAFRAETRIVETAAGFNFGRVVSKGTGVKGAVLGGAIADILGVTLKDITLVKLEAQTLDKYPQNYNAGIMNEGDIWVIAVNGCTAGLPVTYLAADGTFAPAATPVTIPGSRWLTTASAAGLAVARIPRMYHTT